MNKSKSKPAALIEQGYCYDLDVKRNSYYAMSHGTTVFERTINSIRDDVYFVDDISYLQLLELAKERLRQDWSHLMALELAKSAYPHFQELRKFLKSKSSTIKLSGYEDLDHCNLKEILSVDDFSDFDHLLVRHGIPKVPNFRKASFLEEITDAAGHLRLVERIDDITLTQLPQDTHNTEAVAWHVLRNDGKWRFRPDIGKNVVKRKVAKAFAKQWREDDGELCFTAGIDALSAIVEQGIALPAFPALSYHHTQHSPTATAVVQDSRISAYGICGYPNHQFTAEGLKEVLREHFVSMTGNKDAIMQKLATLAATEYDKALPEMDTYFHHNRFIRMATGKSPFLQFPILEHLSDLRNLLITLYVAKHMHGNAIITATHENNAFTVEELAHALITGKTRVEGTFLPGA